MIEWYQMKGKNAVLERPKKVNKRNLISEIKDKNLEYSKVLASIFHVKEDSLFYESDPIENCNKIEAGGYVCEGCNYTYDKCKL